MVLSAATFCFAANMGGGASMGGGWSSWSRSYWSWGGGSSSSNLLHIVNLLGQTATGNAATLYPIGTSIVGLTGQGGTGGAATLASHSSAGVSLTGQTATGNAFASSNVLSSSLISLAGVTGAGGAATLAVTGLTAPMFSSFAIGTNGTTLTATASVSTSVGAGGNGGLSAVCATAGTVAANYTSGVPGTSPVWTLASTVNSGDTCTGTYTQPGNGYEATTGGADVASFTLATVTNNSTHVASTNFGYYNNGTTADMSTYTVSKTSMWSVTAACTPVTHINVKVYGSGAVPIEGAIAADSSGSPGAVTFTTASTTGTGSYAKKVLTFASPYAVTVNNTYWIGFSFNGDSDGIYAAGNASHTNTCKADLDDGYGGSGTWSDNCYTHMPSGYSDISVEADCL